MATQYIWRALLSFLALQSFVVLEARAELHSVDVVTRGKQISATSTCSASMKYCYSPGETNVVCATCSGDERIDRVIDDSSLGFWLSAPLPNDPKDEQVNITINLMKTILLVKRRAPEKPFQIHEITVTTAFTPLPAVWVIEGSRDGGRHYKVVKYFVSEAIQCSFLFDLTADEDDGICIVQTPIKNGLSEKTNISLDVIADHIRLRFISLSKSEDLEQFDEFSRYYTLQDISVKGSPNTKASLSLKRVKKQACYCSSIGTAGSLCNAPAGRVCPCRARFGGKRCSKCARGYYDFPTCKECGCSKEGSTITWCKRSTGLCRCKPLIEGRTCNKCIRGYYGFPTCTWCGCHLKHSKEQACDSTGKCLCKVNYDGKDCARCKLGYENYPECKKIDCFCTLIGSTSKKCNSKGLCQCKEGYKGVKCDQCSQGYFGYPDCRECGCHEKGALFSECDSTSGRCVCYPHLDGRKCDRCISGYFGFPHCRPCTCNRYGTQQNALSGNSKCQSGKEQFKCKCKKNVAGALCDTCKDLHYLFSPVNPLGCSTCGCFKPGTIGGLESCDENSGHCACKPFVEEGKCHECRRGYHSLKALDTFGCTPCTCNPGGARYGNCDKRNGKCQCRRNVGGFLCDRTVTGPVYTPSLHHISVEMEDGRTIDGKKLRYDFDNNVFPLFSWKGYVQFSSEQSAVVLTVNIPKRSVYRIFFRCIFEPVGYPTVTTASITISPTDGVAGFSRSVTMEIKPTRNNTTRERSALLALSQDGITEEFLMFTGKWAVTISCESKYLLMDYVVFLPEEYYEGDILQTEKVSPCIVDGINNTVCDLYSYPDIKHESVVKFEAEHGYYSKKAWHYGEKLDVKYYRNNEVLKQMKANGMVLMNKDQNRFTVDINIPKTGYYVFIIHYYCPGVTQEKIDLYVHRERGALHIVPCTYQFGCRQVVMKEHVHVVKKFDLTKGFTRINLFTSKDANIAIDYIKAIPYELWHPTYINPALVCRSLNGKCISSQYEEIKVFKRLPLHSQSTINPFTSSRHGSKVAKFRKFFNSRRDNYQLVLQYQQTAHVIVDCDVVVETYKTVSQGTVRLTYCPSQEFCRVVITPVSKAIFNIPQGTTAIELRLPLNADVKISWLYVVQENNYSPNILALEPFDNSKTFTDQCSRNHYSIDPSDRGYCMRTSFALTTHFNNGALPCRCSYYGSRSRYCNRFHGQCQCRRPNIIGRQCSRCASGYYGFPYCRRCTCDPRGSESGTCDYLGRCKCKANYSGTSCTRCKSGFYGFPKCKACNCNNFGSLSTFCTSSGQCQCRRSFDGKTCDKCRIGFFGFPNCKECNCDASGIKPVEGLPSGCNSSNAVKCTCKDNVQGPQCDTCKDYHYNLQFDNPKGCEKCSCSALGTNGQLKTCSKVSGKCPCKPHVTGQGCANCKDGYTSLKDYSMFGCKGCACDYGGSWDNNCDKKTGTCSCKKNVAGKKCRRVKSKQFYIRDLLHVRAEFEDATLPKGQPVAVRHLDDEFPGFSGRGYIQAIAQQSSIDVIVSVPRPSKYHLMIRYILSTGIPVFVQVTISPTDQIDPLPQGYEGVQVVSTEFTSSATSTKTYAAFLTVKKDHKPVEFFLTRGKWRISLFVYPSPSLFLDYFVLIPEDYYKATHLRKRVQKPCTGRQNAEQFCVEYKYLDVASANAITIPAKIGVFAGTRGTPLPYAPLDSVVLNPQSQLLLPSPIPKDGEYVLLINYYQVEATVSEIIVMMTIGFTDKTAHVATTQCKYSFGCRQVAIDDTNKVMLFYLSSNLRTLLYISPQTIIAVKSVSFISAEAWNMEYLIPEEHCVKMDDKCVPTTYSIPRNAIRVDAEKSGQGMKPSLAMDNSVRAAYLAGDGVRRLGTRVSLRIKSRIDNGRYKILVHYYQPSYGRYYGRIIVESGRSTALSLYFKFCPNVGGCRALARDKLSSFSRSLYIYDSFDITITIPAPNELWIDYILFVPIREFKPSMEHPQPVSLAKQFLKDCTENNFIITKSSSKFCQQSMFTVTTRFNDGVPACNCNRQGARSTSCDSLGGQCHCKENVVGRKCDKCKGGYTGFPKCKRG